jgi:hypothetical protein
MTSVTGSVHDASVRAEWLSSAGWRRIAGYVLLAAACMLLLGYALFGEIVAALVYAAITTVVLVVCLAAGPWQWRAGRGLGPDDRRAVADAVFRGDDIGDTRLVPATMDLAEQVMRRTERERRRDTPARVVAAVFLALTAVVYLAGPDANPLAFVLFVLGWVALFLGAPRLRDRRARSAGRAYGFAITYLPTHRQGGR